MTRYTVKLPDIGEGIAESEISDWHIAVGDAVEEDQPLVDMLTDKAAVELPSPVAGKVVELCGQPGDKIAVGGALVILEVETAGHDQDAGADRSPDEAQRNPGTAPGRDPDNVDRPPEPPPAESPSPRPVAAPPHMAQRSGDGKVLASPAVRRRAREHDVELSLLSGTGPNGRVTRADLEAWLKAPARPQARAPEVRDDVEEIKVIGLRRKIAEAMQRSKQRIPHFAYVEEVDVTELEALRVHLNDTRRDDQPKLTLLPFLLRALVRALPDWPQINATYDDEAGILRRYSAVHCGVATQTPNGLLVPVLRHAETLDVWHTAAEIARLAEAARAGKAAREELTGSSITITSLGALGGIASTPVINAPEVAIVGVNRMVQRPVYLHGQLVPRQMMNLSSSFDHRIVDGYDAAAFIQAVKRMLEHPATLFMAEA